ncbi:MAG: helix-turn-helix transcriptional regulator [Tabrizicola sp.]|nr:helix-turn-helix transcriptional regulator [Tabrizicola sp.]
MPNQQSDLDRLFHALADPTRRAVVARLAEGVATTSALAEPFEMALPSFTQHMAVLERAGLVASEKRGRVRTYALRPRALADAEIWLSGRRAFWEARLDQLDAFLLSKRGDGE